MGTFMLIYNLHMLVMKLNTVNDHWGGRHQILTGKVENQVEEIPKKC